MSQAATAEGIEHPRSLTQIADYRPSGQGDPDQRRRDQDAVGQRTLCVLQNIEDLHLAPVTECGCADGREVRDGSFGTGRFARHVEPQDDGTSGLIRSTHVGNVTAASAAPWWTFLPHDAACEARDRAGPLPADAPALPGSGRRGPPDGPRARR